MRAGPSRRRDRRDLAERHRRRPPSGPLARSAAATRDPPSVRDSGASRTVTSRVSPVGSTQSPASMPANAGRSACADLADASRQAIRRGRGRARRRAPASGPCVDSPTSTAPGTCRTSGQHLIGDLLQLAPCRARGTGAGSASGHRRSRRWRSTPSRRPAAPAVGRSSALTSFWLPFALVLRRELHVRRSPSSTAPRPAADGGVGVGDLRLRARDARRPPRPSAACTRGSIPAASRARC